MGDNLLGNGVVVAVIGICTVFIVLALLWGVLAIMQRIFASVGKHSAATGPQVQKAAPEIAAAPLEPSASTASDIDEDELIAVLTAAVAASLNTSTYNLQIRSYRQVNADVPVWNRAARTENVR